jgi:hypothetical protein
MTRVICGSVVVLVLGLASVMACSDDSDSGGNGGTNTSSGGASSFQTCQGGSTGNTSSSCTPAETKPYTDCIQSKCEATYRECYGNDYLKGTLSGPCGAFVGCTQKCTCTDVNCMAACKPDQACTSCNLKVAQCVQQCPAPACATAATSSSGGTSGTSGAPGTSGGTSGGAAKTCADLKACCDRMTNADLKKACSDQHTALGANDGACSLLLAGYQSQCP